MQRFRNPAITFHSEHGLAPITQSLGDAGIEVDISIRPGSGHGAISCASSQRSSVLKALKGINGFTDTTED